MHSPISFSESASLVAFVLKMKTPFMKTKSYWSTFAFIGLLIFAYFWPNSGQEMNLLARLSPPNYLHWFGTDWLGRDMFSRTLKALMHSLSMTGIAIFFSAIIALILAIIANLNRGWNMLIDFIVDCALSLPSLLLLMILTVSFGSGSQGVMFAIALSHWPKLTRLCKSEIQSLMCYDYISHALNFGHKKIHVILQHAFPHVLPQWMTGMLLLLPHGLLHSAALSFLGFGSDPTRASMGKIFDEANSYLLTGQWWLAVLPGLMLVFTIILLSHCTRVWVRNNHLRAPSCCL